MPNALASRAFRLLLLRCLAGILDAEQLPRSRDQPIFVSAIARRSELSFKDAFKIKSRVPTQAGIASGGELCGWGVGCSENLWRSLISSRSSVVGVGWSMHTLSNQNIAAWDLNAMFS